MSEAFLSVRLGPERWLVRLSQVRELLPMVALQAIQVEAKGCVGMLNLRGEVLPVYCPQNVDRALGPNQFILVTAAEESIGLVLDGVDEVQNLTADQLSQRTFQGRTLEVAALDGKMIPVLAPGEDLGARA